jgi:hypothetical protein
MADSTATNVSSCEARFAFIVDSIAERTANPTIDKTTTAMIGQIHSCLRKNNPVRDTLRDILFEAHVMRAWPSPLLSRDLRKK